jgi:hypothetical protein
MLCGLRKACRRGARAARARVQGIGALADRGQGLRGRLRAAGDGCGRALELAHHAFEFDIEQFEDVLCAIIDGDRARRFAGIGRLREHGGLARRSGCRAAPEPRIRHVLPPGLIDRKVRQYGVTLTLSIG